MKGHDDRIPRSCRKGIGRASELCHAGIQMVITSKHRLTLMLLAIAIPAGIAFLTRSLWSAPYEVGRAIEATDECTSGGKTPDSFDMNFMNANELRKKKELQVILHRSEGCLRVGQELPFSGIKRHLNEKDRITRSRKFGLLKIVKLQKVDFENLSKSKRKYLSRKLALNPFDLRGRAFVVVDLAFLSGPKELEDNSPSEDLDE